MTMHPEESPEIDEDDAADDAKDGDGAREPKAKLSPNLSGKQRRFLRAKGHLLAAVLQIGKDGMTDPLVKNALVQLEAHELIKVKVGDSSPINRHRAAEALAAASGAELAQVLGRTFLIYKARKKDPVIKLPK